MLIKHRDNGNEGVFYIEQNGEELAQMTYALEDGKMVIYHTEVDESLRGKNIGFQLVEQGVEYARQENLKILPLCEYARAVIHRSKDFQDVL